MTNERNAVSEQADRVAYYSARIEAQHPDEYLVELDSDWTPRKPGPYDLAGPYNLSYSLGFLLASDHPIQTDEFVEILHHIDPSQHRWRNAILRDGCAEEVTTLVATRGVQKKDEFAIQDSPVIGRLPNEAVPLAADGRVSELSLPGGLRIQVDGTGVSVTILRASRQDRNKPPELHWWVSDDDDDTFGQSGFTTDDSNLNALCVTIPLAATKTLFCAIQSP